MTVFAQAQMEVTLAHADAQLVPLFMHFRSIAGIPLSVDAPGIKAERTSAPS